MLLLLALVGWTEARILKPCGLARELMARGANPDHVPIWVCIAKHESNLDTAAVGSKNTDGSLDHGIFQISDRYWCSPHGWACKLPCHLLEDDDISDDWRCVNRIYRQQQFLSGNGFMAWNTYFTSCSHVNWDYLKGCRHLIANHHGPLLQETLQVSSTNTSSSTTEQSEISLSAREGNNAEKVQVIDLEMMEKKGRDLIESPNGL